MNNIDAKEFFSASGIENSAALYAKMRSIAPVCQIGEMRAFFTARYRELH